MKPISSEKIHSYENNGYLILHSGLSKSDIAELKKEILEFLTEVENSRAEDQEYQKVRQYRRFAVGLHLQKERIREYVTSPLFKEIGKVLIGPDVDLFATSTITKSEGRNSGVDWHQDLVYDKSQNLTRIICWTSITESNPENGGLFIFPGSHKMGLIPHVKSDSYEKDLQTIGFEAKDAFPLHLEMGHVVVLHPLVVHGSFDNKTKSDRIALMSMYQKPKLYSDQEMKIKMEILRENDNPQ